MKRTPRARRHTRGEVGEERAGAIREGRAAARGDERGGRQGGGSDEIKAKKFYFYLIINI